MPPTTNSFPHGSQSSRRQPRLLAHRRRTWQIDPHRKRRTIASAGAVPRVFPGIHAMMLLLGGTGLVAKEIGAAPDDQCDPARDLGAVNRAVLAGAKPDQLESGATVRIDSTVTAALMYEPSDSALLWDAVRVMTRLLRQAAAFPGAPVLQCTIAGA
jgi:hypothetical protein